MNPYSLVMSNIQELNDLERDMLSKMRGLIFRAMPYMTHVGMALPVRSLNGQGANIITKSGVVILDFVALSEWTPRQQAAELAQLWLHWTLDHDKRFEKVVDHEGMGYASPWWIATDCAIAQLLESNNSGLPDDRKLKIPEQMARKETYGLKSDTAEDLYFELINLLIDEEIDQQSGGSGSESGNDDDSFDDELEKLLNGDLDGDDDQGQGQPSQGQGQFGDDMSNPHDGQSQSGTQPTAPNGDVPHYYNGSGVGGMNPEFEMAEDADLANSDANLKSEMVPDWKKTMIQKATANDMREYSRGKSAGNTPGEFERWADELLAPPKVNWQTIFRRTLRNEMARRSGVSDFTWSKLPKSRGNMGGVIQPRMTSYVPGKIGVFVDTSGSMSEHDLAIALNEVKGMLIDYDVVAYAIDVVAHEIGPIGTVKDFKLSGGGGTDMGVAIDKAVEDKLEAMVVLTDGETGWRPKPERSTLFAVAGVITHQDEDSYVVTGVPDWMEAIHIPATHGMDGV